MKNTILALCLLMGLQTAYAQSPSHYSCEGVNEDNEDISMIYSTTSLTGRPIFVLQRDSEELVKKDPEYFSVNLQKSRTILGTMLSAKVDRKRVIGLPSQVYSVFIPAIHLGRLRQANFQTTIIFSSVGAIRGSRVQQRIEATVTLECHAQRTQS